MDRNKAKAVVRVGLHLGKCCGTCGNWVSNDLHGWGVCRRFSYLHEKHQEQRLMSCHWSHCCTDTYFKVDLPAEAVNFLSQAYRIGGTDE